jgi:hypothetical protein
MELGLIWRWKQFTGLDFQPDLLKYQQRLYNAKGRDASKATLNMGGNASDFPAIVITPAGSWGV